MACRGVFFALTTEQREQLLKLQSDDQRLDYLQMDIEEAWDEEHLLQTDKAWDAIHRCLTDGLLATRPATSAMGKLILGGKHLYSDTQNYIINFIEAEELPEIAAALHTVTKEWMRQQYDKLRDTDYPKVCISEIDWEYTWEYFSEIPPFIDRAIDENRSVIFSVDQ
jgi:Domain of unknown function (DUF1877)